VDYRIQISTDHALVRKSFYNHLKKAQFKFKKTHTVHTTWKVCCISN